MTIKIDTNFWYKSVTFFVFRRSNLYTSDEVLFAVGAELSDGQLRTGENDRLRQILQHIGEGRGCVGHRIGSVQYDETVVLVIVICNDMRKVGPQLWRHIAGINRRIELMRINLHIELFQFRYT